MKTPFMPFLLVLSLLLMFTGCWGMVEINEVSLVLATGIDIEEDGRVRVTVISTQPQGSVSHPSELSYSIVLSAVGKNIIDAVDRLNSLTSKQLVWIHNALILVGKEAAESIMDKVADFSVRNRELRFRAHLIIVDGSAHDLMQVPSIIERNLSASIEGIVRNQDNWAYGYTSSIKDFLTCFVDENTEFVTSKLDYIYTSDLLISMPREKYADIPNINEEIPHIVLNGGAVFKGYSLKGWLNEEETKGYLWITNKIMPGILISNYNDGDVSVEIIKSKTSLKIAFNGNDITAVISVKAEGKIESQTSSHDIDKTDDVILLENHLSKEIEKEMRAAIRKAQQELDSDIFGFRQHIYRHHPAKWREIEPIWESIYKQLKVEYDVKLKVKKTGMITRAIITNEK